MKDIIIICAGGFGKEVEWLIERINEKERTWNILGYADDTMPIGTIRGHSKIICGIKDLLQINHELSCVIAIANSQDRKNLYDLVKVNKNLTFPNLIDKDAIISDTIMGQGNIFCAGCILTVNVTLGDFNIINLNSTIGHDSELKDFIMIYPNCNVSGNVLINSLCEIGTGSQIIEKKKITNNVIIGAGGVVVKDILESGTYVGVPVNKIK